MSRQLTSSLYAAAAWQGRQFGRWQMFTEWAVSLRKWIGHGPGRLP